MSEKYEGIRYLGPGDFALSLDDLGHLCATMADGERHQHVHVYRTRPISNPNSYISLRVGETPSEQRELGIIRHLDPLPIGERRLIAEQLDLRYFVHTITHIRSIREELGFLYWTCESNKGTRHFAVPRGDPRSVVTANDVCRIVTDIDGNRYEIPDLTRLDATSRALFHRYIYW